MDIEIIMGLVGTGVTTVSLATGYVLSVVKARKELKIASKKEADEIAARVKAEKQKFYLTTAANLVLSADKLALTGPQKKEYVMTWLENEAVKAGIEVDKALMSVAIERTILILNDYKDKTQAVSSLLKIELDDAVAQEQIKIDLEASKALASIERTSQVTNAKVQEGITLAKTTISNVKNILNKK